MATRQMAWQTALQRFLCNHEWEPIGWAMDSREGHCLILQCAHCGQRCQSRTADADGPAAAHSAGHFTVGLSADHSSSGPWGGNGLRSTLRVAHAAPAESLR